MIFGGIQRTSTIDFPGVLCCVVFTAGCDLDCFYCHNRSLIDGSGARVSETEVLSFLEKRKGLLDGVVVSGGEPTLQEDLPFFLRRVRALGYKIKLDTNGQRPEFLSMLLKAGLLDYVAVDLKAAERDYASVCGGHGYAGAAQSLRLLMGQAVAFEARTTLYPGLTMQALETLLASFPALPRWRLNYFQMPAAFRLEDRERLSMPALTPQAVNENRAALLALQPNLIG